jgi:hypothetical protein
MSGLCRPVQPVAPVLASSGHAAERVGDPRSPTYAQNFGPWASMYAIMGQAVHAERVADIGNPRLGELAPSVTPQ